MAILGPNRPESALFSNLEHAYNLAHNSFGNRWKISRLFALPSKPGLAPESRGSPIISARQEIVLAKGGGYCTEHLTTRVWLREKPRIGKIAHCQP